MVVPWAKLGRTGYVLELAHLPDSLVKHIKYDLTVAPKADGMGFSKRYKMFVENTDRTRLAVPRFYGAKLFGACATDFGAIERLPHARFEGQLRPELGQDAAVKAALVGLKQTGGAILCLQPGAGKTVCALYLAAHLRMKTLVLTHKEFLMNQWIERIREFLPGVSVGRLQQGIVQTDCDVVVGMLQSIATRDYPRAVFGGFGLLVVDESHHVAAPVFSRVMFHVCCPYVLGLTATPERKDGLTNVLHWFMGDIVYRTERRDQRQVQVHVSYFEHEYLRSELPTNKFGRLALASVLTELVALQARNRHVLDLICRYAAQGRKLFVLSDRRQHCVDLQKAFAAAAPSSSSALYLGGMSGEQLKAAEAADVIFATYSLATEGLDIPTLDTLVLATPKSDVVQATGRILRETPGKKHLPLVVDIVDCCTVFFAQFNKRRAFYTRCGFALQGVRKVRKQSSDTCSGYSFKDD